MSAPLSPLHFASFHCFSLSCLRLLVATNFDNKINYTMDVGIAVLNCQKYNTFFNKFQELLLSNYSEVPRLLCCQNGLCLCFCRGSFLDIFQNISYKWCKILWINIAGYCVKGWDSIGSYPILWYCEYPILWYCE